MKNLSLFAILVLAATNGLVTAMANDGEALDSGPATSLVFTHVAMDAQGASYFDEGEVHFEQKNYAPPSGPLGVAQMPEPQSLVFTTMDSSWRADWHPAPKRQFVFVLSGAISIEVENGEVRRFESGDVIYLEDISGRGHDTQVVSQEPASFAITAVSEDLP